MPLRLVHKLNDWPFALKLALPPAIALAGVMLVGVIGYTEVEQQTAMINNVVGHDLVVATTLKQDVALLQSANGGLYRLLTLQAAKTAKLDIDDEVARLTQRIDQLRADLATIEAAANPAEPRPALGPVRDELSRYSDTIRVVGTMLEVDFMSAVELVRPFDANATRMIDDLNTIADNVVSDAGRRARRSAQGARDVRAAFVIAVAAVAALASLVAWEITRRTVFSVRRIADATLRVAGGDQALLVDQLARRDELGDIVESLRSFQRNNARINFLAHHDALTTLPNRRLFHDRVVLALEEGRFGRHCAVFCLDLDHFKAVNDTLGHPVGDLLLQQVAARLAGCVRDGDTVARLGGDEFAIVLLRIGGRAECAKLAQRVIESVSQPYEINGHQLIIGTSVGIAMTPCADPTVDAMLKNADTALYRAKGEGRSTYRFFEPDMDLAQQQRHMLKLDMRAALAHRQFELYYQPLVNVNTREVSGFEALIRWHHPSRGMVSPAEFIPLAEETGMIVQIGAWALLQACTDAATWPDHIKVAVNLSPLQFRDRNLVPTVQLALDQTGLPPWRLELEITEGVLLHDNDATLATLHKLRDLGMRISMDDFGTGYSSLSYLRSFPFDKIKIDQSFIRDLSETGESAAIVRAVTGLSSSLGMWTTAEGVETEEQLARLIAEGCTEVQGYLFSPPKPASEVFRLIADIGRRRATSLVAIARMDTPTAEAVKK
jgi:diguanylate cyclase (GGDEF)-like protein